MKGNKELKQKKPPFSSSHSVVMLAQIKRRRKTNKIVLLIYLPTLRQWIMDTGSFTKSECTYFWKGKQAYTRIHGLRPSSQGRHAVYLPNNKWETKQKYLLLIINLQTVIRLVNKGCRFSKRETTLQKLFLITLAFRTVGDTKLNLGLTEW